MNVNMVKKDKVAQNDERTIIMDKTLSILFLKW